MGQWLCGDGPPVEQGKWEVRGILSSTGQRGQTWLCFLILSPPQAIAEGDGCVCVCECVQMCVLCVYECMCVPVHICRYAHAHAHIFRAMATNWSE